MKESHINIGIGLLCVLFGKTRYSYYKKEKNSQKRLNKRQAVLEMVSMVRRELPRIGTPKLYYMLKKSFENQSVKMGRDSLHRLLRETGMIIRPKKRYIITTNSNHWMKKYPNLIKGLNINRPEQLWVCDITYIQVGEGFCFLSLITDAYSRRIMGYCLHPTLEAQGCINALKMALANKANYNGRHIHHSDRGSQYCSSDYVGMLQSAEIEISMTENGDPYENAVAERVNGILKHEFNLNQVFTDHAEAIDAVDRSIDAYNFLRPHMSCNYLTPMQAHQMTGNLKKHWKPKVWHRDTELAT
jgi:transposase InsO family protein